MKLHYPFSVDLVTEWPGARGKNTHYGTDFAVDVGTPVKSSFDGVVVFAGGDGAHGELYPGSGIWANGEALVVDVERADGLVARFIHLSRIDVKVGQKVRAGQRVGLSGNTGWSTGPHLHWELRRDREWVGGTWVDPRTLNPQPLPASVSGDESMQSVNLAGKHLFGVNNEFITHYGDVAQADITRKVMSVNDELHHLSVAQFNCLLDGLGIPRDVVRDGTVFNPQSGKFERNGTWSRGREILSKLGVK